MTAAPWQTEELDTCCRQLTGAMCSTGQGHQAWPLSPAEVFLLFSAIHPTESPDKSTFHWQFYDPDHFLCNNIFKMTPCLQVAESRSVLFFLLPVAKRLYPKQWYQSIRKWVLGHGTACITLTTFIFHPEIKAKTCFSNLCFTSFSCVLLFWVNSKYCKDVFKDRQLWLKRNWCKLQCTPVTREFMAP